MLGLALSQSLDNVAETVESLRQFQEDRNITVAATLAFSYFWLLRSLYAQTALSDLGVPASNYHHESFDFGTSQAEEESDAPPLAEASVSSFSVTFAKMQRTVSVRAGETILKVAKAAGIPLPSSCATGLCGTCKTRKLSGDVEMNHQGGIRKREVDAGLFLPCCSKPRSDLVLDR
jgi:ferredoxin